MNNKHKTSAARRARRRRINRAKWKYGDQNKITGKKLNTVMNTW